MLLKRDSLLPFLFIDARRSMKTIKLKSIFALILFSILTFGLTSIATSAGTNISNNGFEDSFPKTAGGYVVWQGKAGNDWEIFLYNANNGFGPVQITDNNYGDVNPETDGRYVTWASGFSPNGEIFLYDIATSTTIRITDYQYTDHVNTSCTASADPYPCCTGGICVGETPENCDGSCDSRTECVDTYGGSWTGTGTCNSQYDHDPKIVDGVVVWVSHSEGVDTMYGPGDIMLYNAAYGSYENISRQIDPNNEHDDYAFRFDGNRIQWVQNTSGDMPNYVYDPITDSWGQVLNSYIRNYVYDLTTNKYYRYYIPDDGDLDFDAEYYVEDLTAGTAYIQTDSPAVLVDQQSDGDFSVNAMWINGDREILLMDRQNKHGGFLTNNDIKDIQPAIKDNIVVWTGGEGNNSEIYLYKIKVIATTQGTAALIDQFISSGDISDPGKLYDYLSDAQGNIDIDKNHNAINNLDQFKEEIDKLKKKENVSEAAAVVLTGAADAMIVELSGGAPQAETNRKKEN